MNIKNRWEHIGERIRGNSQMLPHALDEKINAIRNGEDTIAPILHSTELSSDTHSVPDQEETWLPVSKNIYIPAPNVILRSALFGVIKKGVRKYEKRVLKATFNGYTVRYTGEQLDQSDLDVWLECLQRCQSTQLGHTVRFSSNDFLKSINRNAGKSDHEWLKSVFLRLRTNDVEISDGRYTYMGSLIFEQYRDEETGDNCLVLNPKIAACFSDAGWTGMNKIIRIKLKGKPLTLWLFGFYSSHAKPLSIKVSTLKDLCGSISTIKEFKRMLRKSLEELAFVSGWECRIGEDDLVYIKK
ncbi:plasmid replication initiator TrfA [Yersinia pestis]|nr:plasmid replication initiator TrfA [Yersinia pestis]